VIRLGFRELGVHERIAGRFQEMFEHSNRGGYGGTVTQNIADLPDDLEQWVMSEES